jgi:hypothetical protein
VDVGGLRQEVMVLHCCVDVTKAQFERPTLESDKLKPLTPYLLPFVDYA